MMKALRPCTTSKIVTETGSSTTSIYMLKSQKSAILEAEARFYFFENIKIHHFFKAIYL